MSTDQSGAATTGGSSDAAIDLLDRLRDLIAWDPGDGEDEGFALLGEAAAEIEILRVEAQRLLDASAGILGAYQVWLQTGDGSAAERLDLLDAAWASLHRHLAARTEWRLPSGLNGSSGAPS